MFENILGQDEAVGLLRADIEANRLPPSLLLEGPPGSGKMSAALELARALSCTAGAQGGTRAAWNCPCSACARHRVLAHPDLLLLGARSFPEELPAALELLGRSPGRSSAYFFVRAARKLARRFDAALYAGEESRLAKAAPLVREVEEALEAVAPDRAEQSALASGAAQAADRAAAASAKLEALVPETPPVFMVRNVEVWARLAPLGPRKVVAIENADRMLEGARNALLKILEEPPESVRFVLTSSRKSAVMATVLSRTRPYSFRARDAEGAALVIGRVFRSSEPAPSVASFLAARRAFPPTRARELARAFLGAALAARSDALASRASEPGKSAARDGGLEGPLAELAAQARAEGKSGADALADLYEATKDFGQKDERYAASFRSFLEALAAELGAILGDAGLGPHGEALVERIAARVREARMDYESWNRSPSLLAETLLYAIGDAV
jgi:DNA polymerase-3 subunit gamma/tau